MLVRDSIYQDKNGRQVRIEKVRVIQGRNNNNEVDLRYTDTGAGLSMTVPNFLQKFKLVKKLDLIDYYRDQKVVLNPNTNGGVSVEPVSEPESALQVQVGGSHYKNFKIQPLEFTMANNLDFIQGNVVKYICRHKEKNGVEDLKKVIHYAQLAAKLQYGVDL